MSLENVAASRRNLSHGILLMVLAMLLLPGIDAIAKGLSATLPAGEITWSRFFFQCLFLLPFVIRTGALKAGRWRSYQIRLCQPGRTRRSYGIGCQSKGKTSGAD